MKKIIRMVALSATILSIFLTGCGGGGGGGSSSPSSPPTSNESASGIWNGKFYSNVTKRTNIVIGVCTQKEARLWSTTSYSMFDGNISVSGNSVMGSLKAYAGGGGTFPDGSTIGIINITGTIKTKVSISGTYSGLGDNGTFSLTYDSSYERPSSLSLVQGDWFISDPQIFEKLSINIDSNGKIIGFSSKGDILSGNVDIIDSSYNIYQVNINLRSGGVGLTGNYNGHAILSDTTTQNDTFTIGVSNQIASIVGFFTNTRPWPWTQQWGTRYEDRGKGVAIDRNGNIYVTGHTDSHLDGNINSGLSDIFLTKYNSSGVKLWTHLAGTYKVDSGNGIALDSSGNIYVTGSWNGDYIWGRSDIFLMKFDSSGNHQWTQLGGATYDGSGFGVAVDSKGNIYITGRAWGDLDGNTNMGGYDIFLIKYDASGIKQWTKLLGTTADDIGVGVALDISDNVFVAGYTGGSLDGNTNAGLSDVFLTKFDPSGNKQWTKLLGTPFDDWGQGVALDSSGNIYVTGYTGGNLDGNTNAGLSDIFLTKYNSSGVKLWTHLAGTPQWDYAYGVSIDNSGNAYIAGSTMGNLDGNINAGSYDIYLMKYDPAGTKQWTRLLGTPYELDSGNGVAADTRGYVYVTGQTGGGLDGNTNANTNTGTYGTSDIFLLKYDSNGAKQ